MPLQHNHFYAGYITDQHGDNKSVVLDYQAYRKIQEILLGHGSGKAMKNFGSSTFAVDLLWHSG